MPGSDLIAAWPRRGTPITGTTDIAILSGTDFTGAHHPLGDLAQGQPEGVTALATSVGQQGSRQAQAEAAQHSLPEFGPLNRAARQPRRAEDQQPRAVLQLQGRLPQRS